MMAFLLLGFMRSRIHGPTPFHLVDAPSPGTGKDLPAGCSAILTTGRPASCTHPQTTW
jgi:hypothetical protein